MASLAVPSPSAPVFSSQAWEKRVIGSVSGPFSPNFLEVAHQVARRKCRGKVEPFGSSCDAAGASLAFVFADQGDHDAWRGQMQVMFSMSLADVLFARGPDSGENGYQDFTESTPSEILRLWALFHYAANGINSRESLGVLRRAKFIAFKRVPLDRLKPADLSLRNCDEEMVAAYAELLRRGVAFPPLVVSRTYFIWEGYHRYLAHRRAGLAEIAVVRF